MIPTTMISLVVYSQCLLVLPRDCTKLFLSSCVCCSFPLHRFSSTLFSGRLSCKILSPVVWILRCTYLRVYTKYVGRPWLASSRPTRRMPCTGRGHRPCLLVAGVGHGIKVQLGSRSLKFIIARATPNPVRFHAPDECYVVFWSSLAAV